MSVLLNFNHTSWKICRAARINTNLFVITCIEILGVPCVGLVDSWGGNFSPRVGLVDSHHNNYTQHKPTKPRQKLTI